MRHNAALHISRSGRAGVTEIICGFAGCRGVTFGCNCDYYRRCRGQGIFLTERVRSGYDTERMENQPELTDEMVAAAAGGSREAVERIVLAMVDRIRLMAYARLNPAAGKSELVEDITQESMESLLRGLPTLQNHTVGGLRSFASTVVTRRVADAIRDPAGAGRGRPAPRSLDSTVAQFSSVGPLCQFLAGSGTSPLSAADRDEQFQRAMTELCHLKEEHRTIITLAFFDQLATGEIASHLGVTRQAAAMTLLRAVRALRERMTGPTRP